MTLTPTDTLIIPLILGLVQVVKIIGISNRFVPLISLLFGIGFTFLLGGIEIVNIVYGIVFGLSASGLWSGTKAIAGN